MEINVFWIFLKVGLVFFGGGYVVIPILHTELVTNLHLLTEQQFIDGIALSQLTPGPVAILATFSGYCISGIRGALVSTFAMFLPGVLLMLFLSKNYEKIRNSNLARKALNLIIPVIVGLLIAAALILGKDTLFNPIGIFACLFSMILLIRFKVNPAILVILAAILGLLLKL